MVCGECGCPITAERQKGHVYYSCTRTRGPCGQRTCTREEVVAEQFSELLARVQNILRRGQAPRDQSLRVADLEVEPTRRYGTGLPVESRSVRGGTLT